MCVTFLSSQQPCNLISDFFLSHIRTVSDTPVIQLFILPEWHNFGGVITLKVDQNETFLNFFARRGPNIWLVIPSSVMSCSEILQCSVSSYNGPSLCDAVLVLAVVLPVLGFDCCERNKLFISVPIRASSAIEVNKIIMHTHSVYRAI